MRARTVLLLVVFAAALGAARPAPAAVGVSVSFFYDELSPYGRWATVGGYGDCWIPSHVAVGWAPYTDGQWIYTDYGWTWVSYDPWGGDPYHYGSWAWEDPYGWVWIPGTVWGPAWVTWCYSDAYVGWAPLPPTVSISYAGYAGPPIVVSEARYVFVPTSHFAGVRVSSVRLPVQQNATIFPRVQKMTAYSVSHGIVVNRGPSVTRVEQAAHARIPRSPISEAKARPVSLSEAGVQRGRRVGIAAPADVRAREIAARRGGAPHTESAGGGSSAAAHHEAPRHEAAPKHEAQPKHETAQRHEAAPKHEAPKHETASNHEAAPTHETPPRHEAVPKHPKHETPPPPPPAPELAPRHEAPPPEHVSPPAHETASKHSPPTHHEPAPHAERKAPPPKHEPPPPGRQADDGKGMS
ncbi:MAG TPA: DUF6600 domain-containing protein [Thermoanaerobaculia bacterium]|nr:DUF6600 domain-containing protein [Thermoanaerobaculia bacterium]